VGRFWRIVVVKRDVDATTSSGATVGITRPSG
jgi:hypothetical protein